MSTLRRSTTGCFVCKTRRKKCDETKPQCLQCLASRRPCSYEYIEHPDSQSRRVKRTKPAPRSLRELLAKEAQATSVRSCEIGVISSPSSALLASSGPPTLARPVPPEISSSKIYPTVTRDADDSLSLPLIYSVTSRLPSNIDSEMISWTSHSTSQDNPNPELEEDLEADNDSKGTRALECRNPTMDRNVQENSLPFVLQCYSQWAITCAFEPLKVTNSLREHVIVQFSSEKTRKRVILIANVMDMFTKSLEIDGTRKSILSRLALDIQNRGARFIAKLPSAVPVLDRHEATRTLDCMIEILGLQLKTQPLSRCIRSLENAAPVFRRACPGPPDEPINLPDLLLDLSLSLRHFASTDITISITTGRPTLFRYEVPFSLELCDRIYHLQLQGNYGLQSFYGVPDQFMLVFAWINSLSETPGVGGNQRLVAKFEDQLPRIKIAIDLDESRDPSLRIQRMVVQESWRYAVQIYLYLVLYKADAYDHRVQRAHQGYMRLISETRPGRRPDVHLCVSMVVAGVATTQELDQDILRQRFRGVGECAAQGTAANNLLLRLEDIWARTRDEGRAAVWSDLRIAYSRLAAK